MMPFEPYSVPNWNGRYRCHACGALHTELVHLVTTRTTITWACSEECRERVQIPQTSSKWLSIGWKPA